MRTAIHVDLFVYYCQYCWRPVESVVPDKKTENDWTDQLERFRLILYTVTPIYLPSLIQIGPVSEEISTREFDFQHRYSLTRLDRNCN